MANKEHFGIINQGVKAWNKWRQNNRDIQPDLRDADLRGQVLNSINLKDALLDNAKLVRTNLDNAILNGCHLNNANLRWAHLSNSDLRGAQLNSSLFQEANLSGSKLDKANIRNSIFQHAQLQNVLLNDTVVENTDFSRASLTDAKMERATLTDVNFTSADLSRCKLRDSKLDRVNLNHASLGGVDLTNVSLVDVDISEANLFEAKAPGVDFTRAKVDRTSFIRAIADEDKFKPGQLSNQQKEELGFASHISQNEVQSASDLLKLLGHDESENEKDEHIKSNNGRGETGEGEEVKRVVADRIQKIDKKQLLEIIQNAAKTRQPELNLGQRDIKELPPEIGQLTNLRKLNLPYNKLTSLPAEIGQLKNLKELSLHDNQLVSLPPEIGQLSNLEKLNLRRNQLSTLPHEVSRLDRLTYLELFGNQLTEVPLEVCSLTNLRELYLHHNKLTMLPPEMGRLINLTRLDLDNNQLTTLPPEIGNLQNLKELYLHENQLVMIPQEIRKLVNLEKLLLHNNPKLELPPEILGPTWNDMLISKATPTNPATILDFYFWRQRGPSRPLDEAKVILVGEGGVGKTSLVNRIVYDKFNKREGKTDGIAINKDWSVPGKDSKVQVNFWDFGGQEIMHATHQFFLTRRALYLLVLDARQWENESNIHYWLKIIRSYDKDSPVLVVTNKCETHHLDLNEIGLKKDYPNICGFYRTSCEEGTGIDELRKGIIEQIHSRQMQHVFDPLPMVYFNIKEKLEIFARNKNYIDIQEYYRLCADHGVIKQDEQDKLLRFLHDLGTVLNFQDDKSLSNTIILSPQWITTAVYSILSSSGLFINRGMLLLAHLKKLLPTERYPRRTHAMILTMMKKFELCYECEPGRYLIPELLSVQEVDTGDWGNFTGIRYNYDVLPLSIMSRFIARMHKHIRNGKVWRTGVVIGEGPAEALVKADMECRTISIYLRGPDYLRKKLLENTQTTLESLNHSFSGLKIARKITIPGKPEIAVDYDHLQTLRNLNISAFVPEGMHEAVNVSELLDIIPGQSLISKRRTLKVRRVIVRNICCFVELDLNLSDNQWNLLLGDNGTGKTTVLRAIALGLCDKAEATALIRPQCRQMIRDKNKPAEIKIYLRYLGEKEDAGTITTTLKHMDGDILVEHQEVSPKIKREDIFVCGYGAARSIFGDKTYDEYLAPEALFTLFDYTRSLQNPELALGRIKGYGGSITEWLKKIDTALMLSPGATRLDEKKGIRIGGRWGELPLKELADGYHFTSAFLFDMLGWAAFFNKEFYATEVSGIVLIDELEQHLHPKWQREIITCLHEQFPDVQFIATTHSPLCAAGIHGELGQNILLETQGDSVKTITDLPVVSAWRADQILASELFGYLIDADPLVENYLRQASILAGKGEKRSPEENTQYQDIKKKLKALWVSPAQTPIGQEFYKEWHEDIREKIKQFETKTGGTEK